MSWTRTQSKKKWVSHPVTATIAERNATGRRTTDVKWPREHWLVATITMGAATWSWIITNFDFNPQTLTFGGCATENGCKQAVKRAVKKICKERGITL